MQLVDKLGNLNKRVKLLQAELESGKNDIKDNSGWDEKIEGDKWIANISTRHITKFDIERATKVCQEYELDWLLKTVVDEKKLEDAIAGGEVNSDLFENCISETKTKMVTFKEKKKK